MRLTEQGLEISINDDPVILAGALNASAALDKELAEANFLQPNETSWGKMRVWANKLEAGFRIVDGRIQNWNFADDVDVERVATNLTPEEMLGALAAYGVALLPPAEADDRQSALDRQDAIMESPEILEQGRRINKAISKVLQVQRAQEAA
jgi:hypothetical protein